MKPIIFTSILILFHYSNLLAQPPSELKAEGGGEYVHTIEGACLSDHDRESMMAAMNQNIERLKQEGQLSEASSRDLDSFEWPLSQSPELDYFNSFGISNFVDQDNTSGLLDYTCNDRTYNGHKGIDYVLWPFPWYVYENAYAHVVAAEAGTIVFKNDGEKDDNCDFSGNVTWNAIFVRHSDGSTAWYGHMKKSTLTSKGVGDMVEKGEYLGAVASSGYSTTAHLHLEVYDPDGNLVDPYGGTCNNLNTSSWWLDQADYREPTVNAVLTHNAEPVHGCPSINEVPNFSDDFAPGDRIYMAAYFHDQLKDDNYTYRIVRPNSTVWQSWNHSSPETYNVSWWYWTWTLPLGGPYGIWKFEIEYQGNTFSHEFNFGLPVSTSIANSLEAIQIFPNPSQDKIFIEGDGIKGAEIKVLDSMGKTLLEVTDFKGFIDLSAFSSGLYFVAVESEEGVILKKVVKL